MFYKLRVGDNTDKRDASADPTLGSGVARQNTATFYTSESDANYPVQLIG